MPFRPPKQQPQFADLKGILSQSKQTDNALYQTVQVLIDRLTQFQMVTLEEVERAKAGEDLTLKFATRAASYITKDDNTTVLPNSHQLMAGTGITFDTSVANELKINSSAGSNVYDSPLTDGDLTSAELIFADGDCIIVQVPV